MRFISLLVLVFAATTLGASGCQQQIPAAQREAADVATAEQTSVTQTVELRVEELTCEGCASQIREILSPLAGVTDTRTNVKRKTVVVDYDASVIGVDAIIAALAREKYSAVRTNAANDERRLAP